MKNKDMIMAVCIIAKGKNLTGTSFCRSSITQNNCEMCMVHNYVLYLATFSKMHKAADLIKAGTTFSMATSDADFPPSFRKQR